MDEQLAVLLFFLNIIPIISRRWGEDNIKLCAMEPLLDLDMYQVRGRQLACVCWEGGAGRVSRC